MIGLAVRNLRRNRRRTALTLGAMIFGVTVMVALRGFVNGQQRLLVANFVEGKIGAVQVHRAGYLANVLASPLSLDLEDSPALRARLAAVPQVKAVAPRLELGAMISSPDEKTSFFMVTAVEPALETQVTPVRVDMVRGGRMVRDDADLVLNAEFARGLGLPIQRDDTPPEQRLALLANDRDGALNGENVLLAGTFPTFTAGDRRTGLMRLSTAQRLLRMEGRVTEYALAVEPFEAAAQVRDALRASLGPAYEVHTWDEVMPFIKTLLATGDFAVGLASLIFQLVIALGIVNAMLMTVLERTREIGTMLALGMRRQQVVSLFVMEGLVLGLVGALAGLALGVPLVALMGWHGIAIAAPGAAVETVIRPFLTLPFVLGVLALVPIGAAVATLWPAWRASRLRPVEALSAT